MIALVLLPVVVCVGALVTAPTQPRRALGALAGFAAILLPWLLPRSAVLLRGIVTVLAGVMASHVIDLSTPPRGKAPPPAARVWHAISGADTWALVSVPPGLDAWAWGRGLLWLVPATIGFLVARDVAPGFDGAAGWIVRWSGGLLFAYATTDAVYAMLKGLYRALGFATPVLHSWPIASRSVQEFWGERWNRTTSTWLHNNCFRPLARRGFPRLGLAWAFLVSALGHAYVIWVALDLRMGAIWLGYFVLQAVLVVVERFIAVKRWPRVAAHAWAAAVMIGASPIFVEPLLRGVGVPPLIH